jgi:hypothetical protein
MHDCLIWEFGGTMGEVRPAGDNEADVEPPQISFRIHGGIVQGEFLLLYTMKK